MVGFSRQQIVGCLDGKQIRIERQDSKFAAESGLGWNAGSGLVRASRCTFGQGPLPEERWLPPDHPFWWAVILVGVLRANTLSIEKSGRQVDMIDRKDLISGLMHGINPKIFLFVSLTLNIN